MAGKRVKKRVKPRTQKQKFLEAARSVDCEASETKFSQTLKTISTAKKSR